MVVPIKKKLKLKIEHSPVEFPEQTLHDCKPVKTTENIHIDVEPYDSYYPTHHPLTQESSPIPVEQNVDDRPYFNPVSAPDKEWTLPVNNLEKEPSKYIYDTYCEINLFDVINSGFYTPHWPNGEYQQPDQFYNNLQREYDDIQEFQYYPMAVHNPAESRLSKFHMPSDSQPVGLGFSYLDLAFGKKS